MPLLHNTSGLACTVSLNHNNHTLQKRKTKLRDVKWLPKVTQQIDSWSHDLADSRPWSLKQHWLTPLEKWKIRISYRTRTKAQGSTPNMNLEPCYSPLLSQEHLKRTPSSFKARVGLLITGNQGKNGMVHRSDFSQLWAILTFLKSLIIGLLQTQYIGCWFWSTLKQDSDNWPRQNLYALKMFKNPLLNFRTRRSSNITKEILSIDCFRN